MKITNYEALRVVQGPEPKWRMALTGNFHDVCIHLFGAPNWFHRLMQRLFFGFRYERLKKD